MKLPFNNLTSFFNSENLHYTKFIVVLLAALISNFIFKGGYLDSFENVTLDQRFRLRTNQQIHSKIIIVEAAEDSIQAIGRWPWDREWHATLIKALQDFGVKLVAFDVLFSEESTNEADYLFADHVEDAGNVLLSVAFAEERNGKVYGLIESIPVLKKAAAGEGHITISPDSDGLLRRIKLKYHYEGRDYYQLGFKVALQYLGVDESKILFRDQKVSVPMSDGHMLDIPLTDDGDLLINWAGNWNETFIHVSYIDVIVSYTQWLKGQTTRIPIEIFEDALCIVGVTATGLFDIRSIPLDSSYPAVGINATILNSTLQGNFLTVLSTQKGSMILWGLAILIFFCNFKFTYLQSTILFILMSVVYVGIAVTLFMSLNLIIPLAYPLFLIFLSYLWLTAYHQMVITMEKRSLLKLATHDTMTGLFNIGHFKLLLNAEIKSVKLRRNQAISLLMVDADHFKRVNDTFGHQSGDEVLKTVADTLKNISRALDVACRYGGEEFVLMLPGAGTQDAVRVAEKIRKVLENTKFYLGENHTLYQMTLSLGVSTYNGKESLDDFIKRADKALYEAKETGRNRVCVAK